MFKVPFTGEIAEFFASKLWPIVTYDNVWDALSREMALQLLDDGTRCCVGEVLDFPLNATNRQFPTITPIPAIDLTSLGMRLKVVSSMLAQRQKTNLIKTEETGYQARDAPRLKILEAARIEQREPQTVPGMIQQINRQREKKCL